MKQNKAKSVFNFLNLIFSAALLYFASFNLFKAGHSNYAGTISLFIIFVLSLVSFYQKSIFIDIVEILLVYIFSITKSIQMIAEYQVNDYHLCFALTIILFLSCVIGACITIFDLYKHPNKPVEEQSEEDKDNDLDKVMDDLKDSNLVDSNREDKKDDTKSDESVDGQTTEDITDKEINVEEVNTNEPFDDLSTNDSKDVHNQKDDNNTESKDDETSNDKSTEEPKDNTTDKDKNQN